MNSVATAVFNNVDITGTIADNGITGINVSNFQFNNGLIDGAGDGANESGLEFINLSGTSSLTNTEIRFSETNSLDIYNTDVNLNLTLNNVIFRDTQGSATNGEGGLQFRSFSSAAGAPLTNIDIIDSDFLRLRTQGIQVIGEDDSIVSVVITNNVIDVGTGIGSGIDINGNDTATVNFNAAASPVVMRLRVSEFDNTNDPRIFLQGFVEGGSGLDDDAVATWDANGNTPGASTANITVSLSGIATAPSAGNAVAPSNPLP